MCSESVHASNTRLRGASKMRVIVSTRSAGSVTRLVAAPIFFLLVLEMSRLRNFSHRRQVIREASERLLESFDGAEFLDHLVAQGRRLEQHPRSQPGLVAVVREGHRHLKLGSRDMPVDQSLGF